MSCSCPRVISPTPGRSTLMTSAPNQASSCVHVGPDWTWVKSRIRTPSSALPMRVSPVSFVRPCGLALSLLNHAIGGLPHFLAELQTIGHARSQPLFLLQHALRVEVADAAAFAAGSGVDHRVDESRLAGVHRRVDGALKLVRGRRVDTGTAEGLHHLVVARAFDEDRRRWVRPARRVDVYAAIDAVVVEHDDTDRQPVA